MKRILSLTIFLVYFYAITTHADLGPIYDNNIYNYSNKPWKLSFSFDYGAISNSNKANSSFTGELTITVDPATEKSIPIYYREYTELSHCCKLSGKVIITDSNNKSQCYVIANTFWTSKPYIRHYGNTGPVVLNSNGKGQGKDGDIALVGDSWSNATSEQWTGEKKLAFGSSC